MSFYTTIFLFVLVLARILQFSTPSRCEPSDLDSSKIWWWLCVLPFNTICFSSYVIMRVWCLDRQILDLTVIGFPVLFFYFCAVYFKTVRFFKWLWWFILWLNLDLPIHWTVQIKSAWAKPIDPFFEPVRLTQGPVYEPTRFLLLKPNIFYCFAKYTTVFHFHTFFPQKIIFSLFSFPLKYFCFVLIVYFTVFICLYYFALFLFIISCIFNCYHFYLVLV